MSSDLSPRRRAMLERFTSGSVERIERMQRALEDFSAGRFGAGALRLFARDMHTLKGEARMMGFSLLGDAASAGEQLVNPDEVPGVSTCVALTRLLTALAAVLKDPASEPTAAILRAAMTEATQGGVAGRTVTSGQTKVPPIPRIPPVEAPPPSRPAPPDTATRILLVDDSPIVRALVSDVLTRAGFFVAEAYDGEAALELIDAVKPDLMLLDLDMPRMNGFQVLSRLRRRPPLFPVVMLTSHSSDEDRAQARHLGACDYMVKADFADDELVGLVKRNLPAEAP